MTQLSEIYNQRILELSANIAGAERLADADGTATAHSKLCGSTVTVDLKLEGDRVDGLRADGEGLPAGAGGGLGDGPQHRRHQRAASCARWAAPCARCSRRAGRRPRAGGPTSPCSQPVKDYKARHASTLLVFDAVEAALAKAEAKQGVAAAAQASA